MTTLAQIIFKNTTVAEVILGDEEQSKINKMIDKYKKVMDKSSRYRRHNKTDVRWWLEQKKCSPFPGTVCEQQDKGTLSKPSFE